jgi:hypothetical protein
MTIRHPLSTKVGTKFRRQVAVAQSIEFARGLKATEFVCLFVICMTVVKLKENLHEYGSCLSWSFLSPSHLNVGGLYMCFL